MSITGLWYAISTLQLGIVRDDAVLSDKMKLPRVKYLIVCAGQPLVVLGSSQLGTLKVFSSSGPYTVTLMEEQRWKALFERG